MREEHLICKISLVNLACVQPPVEANNEGRKMNKQYTRKESVRSQLDCIFSDILFNITEKKLQPIRTSGLSMVCSK